MPRQSAISIAREEQSCTAAEHALIGRHPLHTETVRNRQRFFRDAALRWPYAFGTHPKSSLVQVETAQQLLPSIFGMAKPILRQRQTGARDCARSGIAKQRQNWVIKRRRGNLNRALLRRFCMCRQHTREQFSLSRNHKFLIIERVVMPFRDQRRNVFLLEEEFIEPSDLREHLQIGKILRLKIPFSAIRMIPLLAKPLPQFLVARIPSNDILRICLKQILQRK